MTRHRHARPLTRHEAELLDLRLRRFQPSPPGRPWWDDERKVAALAILAGLTLGVLACIVLADRIIVPR